MGAFSVRKWMGVVCVGLAAPTALAATTTTETLETDHELSLMGSYIEADDKRAADYGDGVKAIYGRRFGENVWGEVQFFANVFESEVQGITDFYQQGLGGDIAYRFFPHSSITPFALIGGGVSRNDVGALDQEQFGAFGNVGLGLKTPEMTSLRVRFRAEARYLYDSFQSDRSDAHFSVGVSVPLGVTRERVVERTEEKIVYRERELVDSDNDGVVDQKDECPGTLEGLTVNNKGCVEKDKEQTIVMRGVTFEFDSATLTANAKRILRQAADSLREQPDLEIEIGGHTDNVGPAEYNKKLSQKRADSVVNFFVDNGIDVSRLTAVGYGETRPAFSNQTEAGRERNRRVELSVKAQ